MWSSHGLTEQERFWGYVVKGPDCWLWIGARTPRGYGLFTLDGRRKVPAHRYSLQLALGEKLPTHIYACHHCDNPPCVRPEHLFAGTQKANMQDAKAKGRTRNEAPEVRFERLRERMRAHREAWKAENGVFTGESRVQPTAGNRSQR